MFPGLIQGTPAQKPSPDTRYLRDDLRQTLKPEQKQVWEAHYPVGQLLPAAGDGLTASELKARVHWYCKSTGNAEPQLVDEALADLAKAGLVLVVKKVAASTASSSP